MLGSARIDTYVTPIPLSDVLTQAINTPHRPEAEGALRLERQGGSIPDQSTASPSGQVGHSKQEMDADADADDLIRS